MRIIAVWSLFARWHYCTTGAKGCSASAQKNTRWATAGKRGLEIFFARMPENTPSRRVHQFRANKLWTVIIPCMKHRAGAAPQWWHWTADILKMVIGERSRSVSGNTGLYPCRHFLCVISERNGYAIPRKERVCGCRRTWSVRNDRRHTHSCSRGPNKRIVAWRLKFIIMRRRKAHGLADWSLGREATSPSHPRKALRQIGV